MFSKTPDLHSFHLGLGHSPQRTQILTLREAGNDLVISIFFMQTSTTLFQSKDNSLFPLSLHRSAPAVDHCLLCDFSALPSSFSR